LLHQPVDTQPIGVERIGLDQPGNGVVAGFGARDRFAKLCQTQVRFPATGIGPCGEQHRDVATRAGHKSQDRNDVLTINHAHWA